MIAQPTLDIQNLRKAERLLRVVRGSIAPTVPTQVVQAFLAVATQEGQTLTDLADSLGSNLSTASRHMLDLGERNRSKEPGYRLVKCQADPMNLRANRYSLTQKGKLLARAVAEALAD